MIHIADLTVRKTFAADRLFIQPPLNKANIQIGFMEVLHPILSLGAPCLLVPRL